MSLVVFAGPTLQAAEIRARVPCTVLAPAAVGDVLRAVQAGARAIALIDGVFERVLPVWHKEILWALGQGIHVFGAASMGALRAAELHPFGMVGVGGIFECYRDGVLEADDEVAVLHGPAEVGYAAVTVALVDVRATLERARAERAVAPELADLALQTAASIHYRDRTWETILAALGATEGRERLRTWLPHGRVDRKREDALLLLDRLAEFLAADPPPLSVDFPFAWTDAWDALYRAVEAGPAHEGLLDELRLSGAGVEAVERAALLRRLALAEAERTAAPPSAAAIGAAGERLRARHGLWRRADLERWLAACDLDAAGFTALCREEAAVAGLLASRRGALAAAILSELRACGLYPALAERARDKALRLAAAGLDGTTAAEAGIDLAPILARLGETVDAEPGELARRLGFADRADLERALLRETQYLRIIDSKNGDAA